MMAQAAFNLSWSVKRWFFDAARVRAMVAPVMLEFLARSGAWVKVVAQRSMRYRSARGRYAKMAAWEPGIYSPAGSPPYAIRNHPYLREFLYFGLDPGRKTVVIGPIRLGASKVAALHEFGGTQRIRNRNRRAYKIGQKGPVRLRYRSGESAAGREIRVPTEAAIFVRLQTAAQVRRANRLNRELYGPATHYVATYPARPYMRPALAKAVPLLPKFWHAAARKTAGQFKMVG